MNSDFYQNQEPLIERINFQLQEQLNGLYDPFFDGKPPARLLDAMRYAIMSKGKRIRPLLVLHSAMAAAPQLDPEEAMDTAWPAAIAVEWVHTYSLIHDDLPALDDDDERRGQPSCHRAFNEATAILAGDGLLSDAFLVLSKAPINPAEQCRELALAVGSCGMVAGQINDIHDNPSKTSLDSILEIHQQKTGRLFVASCTLGGLAVNASSQTLNHLRDFGRSIGLSFQITDDIHDATDKTELDPGELNLAVFGLDTCRTLAEKETKKAAEHLSALGSRAKHLHQLASFILERRY